MDKFWLYLLTVNVVGFLFGLLGVRKQVYVLKFVLLVCGIAGGAAGVLLAFIKCKPQKETWMVFVACCCFLVVQVAALLVFYRAPGDILDYKIWNFFVGHKLRLWYLIVINGITCIVFGWDKLCAKRGKQRVPIGVLLGFCALGGSVLGWFSMYLFRHKTQKDYFVWGVPLILAAQIAVIFCIYNL